ncbi:MAG: PAS domain S-box protein [Wenzhouxiangellaceae bacterium]|nr:PAS domain S-box protein [Wenzhouxiangellaceae bacterium]
MNQPHEPVSSPLFNAVADLAFDSVMVTEASNEHAASKIIFVNDAFTELTGYGRDEVIGETPGMLQGPDTEQQVLDRLDEDLKHDRTFHGQTVNYRKDGTPFHIEWKVRKVIETGDRIYYVAVQREAPRD